MVTQRQSSTCDIINFLTCGCSIVNNGEKKTNTMTMFNDNSKAEAEGSLIATADIIERKEKNKVIII